MTGKYAVKNNRCRTCEETQLCYSEATLNQYNTDLKLVLGIFILVSKLSLIFLFQILSGTDGINKALLHFNIFATVDNIFPK